MSTKTKIEWTDATWNPTRGCSKVSAGCTNCYAMRQAIRQSGRGGAYEGLVHNVRGKGPQWTGQIALVAEALDLPMTWRAPRRVFVDSMSDLFHPDVPLWYVDQVWATMLLTPRHTYQILTKRPARAADYLSDPGLYARVLAAAAEIRDRRPGLNAVGISNPTTFPPRWIWMGTSVEDQAAADERIPHLLRAPAAIRFLSCEPLIGPLDLNRHIWLRTDEIPGWAMNDGCTEGRTGLHWVIAGGESGPGARPCRLDWLRSLRDQCRAAAVPFFLKQLGKHIEGDHDGFAVCRWFVTGGFFIPPIIGPNTSMRPIDATGFGIGDPKGGDIRCWPEDLRVREFPEARP